jgi:ribosomal protein S6
MAEAVISAVDESVADGATSRIYEIGYHIVPSIPEEQLEKAVSAVRTKIEQAGGNFIAEGAPALVRLAYGMETREGDKRITHDRGYFGWIKFEAPASAAKMLEAELKADSNILRSIVFLTVREETRARMKAPTLREVKRTDTIKTTPRRAEENAGTVSEEDLEKALSEITSEQ